MKLKVVYSTWAADGFDEPFGGGVHDLETVTEEQARSIAGAAAAGAVEVVEATAAEQALLDPHVQSQEAGEAALAVSMGEWVPPVLENIDGALVEKQRGYWSGPWHADNLKVFIDTAKDKLAVQTDEIEIAKIERELAEAEAELARVEGEAT